jgi:hypothetical protein
MITEQEIEAADAWVEAAKDYSMMHKLYGPLDRGVAKARDRLLTLARKISTQPIPSKAE